MADQAPTPIAPVTDAQDATAGTIATATASDATASPTATQAATEAALATDAQNVQGATAATTQAEPEKPTDEPALDERAGHLAAKLAKAQAAARRHEMTAKEYGEVQRLAKEDPLAVLQKLGINFEDVILRAAGDVKTEPTTEDKLAQLEEWKAEQEKAAASERQERTRAQQQSEIQQALEITRVELEKSGKFPLIAALGEHGQVFDGIARYIQQYGEIEPKQLPIVRNRVAAEIEKALVEVEDSRLATLIEKAPNWANRHASRFTKTQPGQQTVTAQQAQAPTVTNSTQTAVAPVQTNATRTPEEIAEITRRVLNGEVTLAQLGLA